MNRELLDDVISMAGHAVHVPRHVACSLSPLPAVATHTAANSAGLWIGWPCRHADRSI
jgi:hypothetical protein